MFENRSAPGADVMTPRAGNVGFSCRNYIMSQGIRQVSDLLRHGANNATTAREIASFLGWPVRTVTEQIQRERLSGSPILASCDARNPGYYLASTAADIDDYLNRLAHREKEIQRTRKAIASTQQRRMFDGGDV